MKHLIAHIKEWETKTNNKWLNQKTYPAGALISECQIGKNLIFVLQGRIQLYQTVMVNDSQKLFRINQLSAPSLLDPKRFLIGGPQSITAVTTADTTLINLTDSNFQDICAKVPNLAVSIMLVCFETVAMQQLMLTDALRTLATNRLTTTAEAAEFLSCFYGKTTECDAITTAEVLADMAIARRSSLN